MPTRVVVARSLSTPSTSSPSTRSSRTDRPTTHKRAPAHLVHTHHGHQGTSSTSSSRRRVLSQCRRLAPSCSFNPHRSYITTLPLPSPSSSISSLDNLPSPLFLSYPVFSLTFLEGSRFHHRCYFKREGSDYGSGSERDTVGKDLDCYQEGSESLLAWNKVARERDSHLGEDSRKVVGRKEAHSS